MENQWSRYPIKSRSMKPLQPSLYDCHMEPLTVLTRTLHRVKLITLVKTLTASVKIGFPTTPLFLLGFEKFFLIPPGEQISQVV